MTTISVPWKRGKFKEKRLGDTYTMFWTFDNGKDTEHGLSWEAEQRMDAAFDAVVDKWRWWEAAEVVFPCSAPAIDMEHWADEVVAYLEIVEGEI